MSAGGGVAVIGGGLAGITAALGCADAGLPVTLFEVRPWLGGLTHSFGRGPLSVDNGQHVFLRCCVAYLRLLDRLGVADRVRLQRRLDIPVRDAGTGRTVHLRRNGLPAPLHLGGSLLRYAPLRPAERLRFVRAALALRAVDRSDPGVDGQSFGGWLHAHGQSERAVRDLWDLVGVATLNARAGDASLALAATVFQVGLLTRADAADIGWSRVPLRDLHGQPALAALVAAGARVRTSTRVDGLVRTGEGWRVGCRGEEHMADHVVLAVPPPVAQRLLPPGAAGLPDGWAERLGSAPIVNAHLVYDRRVMAGEFLAGVGTPVQWVFDRTAQSGVTGGQYLALSLSAAGDLVDLPTAVLRERLVPAVERLLPQARTAVLRDFFVTRERHATFRPAPGCGALRPGTGTGLPGLHLAGAWTA
ncbi:MAG TPA: hydroxysqualene dehydroxylase HpnE, partial [Rugosimonospora sp.]|nr:hydroxysqualene dehydroxylase HpnE [Rugosimonospora sp.]